MTSHDTRAQHAQNVGAIANSVNSGCCIVIASDQRERGNLAVLIRTVAGLLRRFAPRNDTAINVFANVVHAGLASSLRVDAA